jgi:hypothetical protein
MVRTESAVIGRLVSLDRWYRVVVSLDGAISIEVLVWAGAGRR